MPVKGTVINTSAVVLSDDIQEYDSALEQYSKLLIPQINCPKNADGTLEVIKPRRS